VGKGMISLETSGNFKKTTAYFNKLKQDHILSVLNRYGSRGVSALANATPVDSGETATSWYYTVEVTDGRYLIIFHNRHNQSGANVAILLQYGHGTRNGGYVIGRDYINPAIQPIFEQIKKDVWKEVSSA